VCHLKQVVLSELQPTQVVPSMTVWFIISLVFSKVLMNRLFIVLQTLDKSALMKLLVVSPHFPLCQDIIPIWILKQCKDELLPTITDIVNCLLYSGKFPKAMTIALVNPLIKKSSLNPSEFKNRNTASNLRFVSKVIEWLVANQLKSYLYSDCPFETAHKLSPLWMQCLY